jgi:hypothetical protein
MFYGGQNTKPLEAALEDEMKIVLETCDLSSPRGSMNFAQNHPNLLWKMCQHPCELQK